MSATGTPIDTLSFAIDGDNKPLKAAFADSEAAAMKTGRAISAAFSASSSKAANDVGAASKIAAGGMREAAVAAEGLGKHAHESLLHIARLGIELGEGRWAYVPVSLTRIAMGFGGITAATLATTAAVVAPFAAITAGAVLAERAFARVNTQLALTRNISGLTIGQIGTIATQIAAGSGGAASRYGAMSTIAELAGQGVPHEAMARAGIGISQFTLAGGKEEEAAGLMGQIFNKPQAAAEEMADKFHMLDQSQVAEIKRLVAMGEFQKASEIELDAFTKSTRDAAGSASLLSRAMRGLGTFFGGFADLAGRATGVGATDADRIRGQLNLARMSHAAGTPGGQAEIASLQQQLAQAQAKEAADAKLKQAGEQAAADDRILSASKSLVDETNKTPSRIQQLTDDWTSINNSLALAKTDPKKFAEVAKRFGMTTAEYIDELQRASTSYGTAKANQQTPGQIAAQQAQDAATVARAEAAGPRAGAAARARVGAEQARREALSDPSKAADAQEIYNAKLQEGLEAVAKIDQEHARTLSVMRAETAASIATANAMGQGRAQGEAMKVLGEARVTALREQQVGEEKVLSNLLAQKAAAAAIESEAGKLASQQNEILGQRKELAAGTDAGAIQQAQAETKARQETEEAQAAADAARMIAQKTKSAKDEAAAVALQKLATDQYTKALAQNLEQLRNASLIEGQNALIATKQKMGFTQDTLNAIGGGATPDDLRHLQVAQELQAKLTKDGMIPFEGEVKKAYDQMLPFNESLSDMQDALKKAQQAAADFADDITGPLESVLSGKGSGSIGQRLGNMVGEIEQNVIGTAVKNYIIQPLNDQLRGAIGNLLGTSATQAGGGFAGLDKPDGSSPASALWVQIVGAGVGGSGIPGANGGSGGGFNIFDPTTWFGGSGNSMPVSEAESFNPLGPDTGAAASSSGGIFSDIGDWFAGLFDGGGSVGPGEVAIKSGVPELIIGRAGGADVIPLRAPVVQATGVTGRTTSRTTIAASQTGSTRGTMSGPTNIHFNFYGPTDAQGVLNARGQMAAAVTRASAMGRRNT